MWLTLPSMPTFSNVLGNSPDDTPKKVNGQDLLSKLSKSNRWHLLHLTLNWLNNSVLLSWFKSHQWSHQRSHHLTASQKNFAPWNFSERPWNFYERPWNIYERPIFFYERPGNFHERLVRFWLWAWNIGGRDWCNCRCGCWCGYWCDYPPLQLSDNQWVVRRVSPAFAISAEACAYMREERAPAGKPQDIV